MEQFDAEKARRVWDRVQGKLQQQSWSFPEILSIKAQTKAMYRRLARHFRGQNRAVLENFFRQEQAHMDILSELCRLHTGSVPMPYTPQSRREPVLTVLQQCYGHKLRLIALYEGYADTQYWDSFQAILADEQTQCQHLLRLMERQPKRHK